MFPVLSSSLYTEGSTASTKRPKITHRSALGPTSPPPKPRMKITLQQKIEGLLLGIAVADAIGLPTEGMTPAKIHKLAWTKILKHRFFFGKGMWSDDTEQTIMLTQALLRSGGDLKKFTRSFASELRWWILGLPAATGLATARAIIKLWLGFPPTKSGVWSAGNGSAMRTAPIAAYFLNEPDNRRAFTIAQTRLTHSDPKAEIATLAITELCHLLLTSDQLPTAETILTTTSTLSEDPEWTLIVGAIRHCISENLGVNELLQSLKGKPERGISGYVYQTVPCVILAGIRNHWEFRNTITELIEAGGDTDTTAAIAGALCGASGGVTSIPADWINNLKEWPTPVSKLELLASALHQKTKLRIRSRWSPFLILRNLKFLAIVLIHGFARLLPTSFLKSKR
jgi:ADP-ribosyl-[dinitrogen reductase] hydrolase